VQKEQATLGISDFFPSLSNLSNQCHRTLEEVYLTGQGCNNPTANGPTASKVQIEP